MTFSAMDHHGRWERDREDREAEKLCGKYIDGWPHGYCTELAGHAGDCDRREITKS